MPDRTDPLDAHTLLITSTYLDRRPDRPDPPNPTRFDKTPPATSQYSTYAAPSSGSVTSRPTE